MFFCLDHGIGLDITIAFAIRMFMAYSRKMELLMSAFDSSTSKGKKPNILTPNLPDPSTWGKPNEPTI